MAQLAEYVTEAGNPTNVQRVARVEARVPVELLRPGLVLVDTPGIGSVFRHDEAAARALLEADGAILVRARARAARAAPRAASLASLCCWRSASAIQESSSARTVAARIVAKAGER